jgi:hypothetical protein
MSRFLRRPLISAAALAAYLLIHVFAPALHHHDEAGSLQRLPIPSHTALQVQTSTGDVDECEEGGCLLCTVVHFAKPRPTIFHFAAATVFTGKAWCTPTSILPPPFATDAHARSPPST